MAPDALDLQAVIDGLGHGLLIFNSDGELVAWNRAAGKIVGPDLRALQKGGWSAATTLFGTRQTDLSQSLDMLRREALMLFEPVRFQIYHSGEHIPCWLTAVNGDKGEVFTVMTIDVPDWTALTSLVDRFRSEVRDAVDSTRGHIDIINSSMGQLTPEDTIGQLTRRIGGFNRLIDMQMYRTAQLLDHMERLENIRTGALSRQISESRRKVSLEDFMEDFLEEVEEMDLLDPETEDQDYRSRITLDLGGDINVAASPAHLTSVLRDVLRNAIMYSLKGTPITVKAYRANEQVQIDIVDEGYGVREKETERVFAPFQRARQPQIISEFGYGLSLYLCKHEVEAMGGRMWFESQEKVGSTFSFKLPAWKDDQRRDDTKPASPFSSSADS